MSRIHPSGLLRLCCAAIRTHQGADVTIGSRKPLNIIGKMTHRCQSNRRSPGFLPKILPRCTITWRKRRRGTKLRARLLPRTRDGYGSHLFPAACAPILSCPATSKRNYAALVAAGKIERDPAQEDVLDSARRTRAAAERASAGAQVVVARLAVRRARAQLGADQGSLPLRRRRPRQDHADGSVLRGVAGAAQASRAFPRIHGRRARARARLPRTSSSPARSATRIRSGSPPRRSPRRPGCSASTSFTSPTLPTP